MKRPRSQTRILLTRLMAATGVALLATVLLTGASAAKSRRRYASMTAISVAAALTLAVAVNLVAPAHAQANEFYLGYLESGVGHPLKAWLVFEVLGVLVGGFVSGALAGRLTRTVEKGPRISVRNRLLLAFAGGSLMGIGAKLARGCTSGQALSGGAVLNVGSWAFMMMVFAGAYALAWFVRRQWR